MSANNPLPEPELPHENERSEELDWLTEGGPSQLAENPSWDTSSDSYSSEEETLTAKEQTCEIAKLFHRRNQHASKCRQINWLPMPSPLRMERRLPDERFPQVEYFIKHLAARPYYSWADMMYLPNNASVKRAHSLAFVRSMIKATYFAQAQQKGLGIQLQRWVSGFFKDLLPSELAKCRAKYGRMPDLMYMAEEDGSAAHKIVIHVDVPSVKDEETEIRFVKQVWREECVWHIRIILREDEEQASSRKEGCGTKRRHDSTQ